MPYVILDVETGRNFCDVAPGLLRQYDTGEEAQRVAKLHSSRHDNRKLRVKKVLDNRWMEREQAKMDSGKYQRVPWIHEGWWNNTSHIHRYHFPHASYKEPGKLAYTESPEKGMDNIHTQIKPGRYLEKYFGENLKAWGYDVREIAMVFAHAFEPRKLRFAATEDEVQWVYERGPASCMSSERYRHDHGWGYPSKGKWPHDIHACRMYIAGDLQVAYIVENDEKYDKNKSHSSIIARSVVWPERKTHSRVYGDEHRMRGLLGAAGYHFEAPIGAKLQRVTVIEDGCLRFVAPYIDAGLRSGEGNLNLYDRKTHLEVTAARKLTFSAGHTGGISGPKIDERGQQVTAPIRCQHCDATEVDTVRVYTGHVNPNTGDLVFRHLCEVCQANLEVFYCQRNNRYYEAAGMGQVTMANGAIWSQAAFNSVGFICQGNGGKYPRSERLVVDDGSAHLLLWSIDYFNTHGFVDNLDGSYCRNEDLVLMDNGQKWSKKSYARVGFECEACGQKRHIAHKAPDKWEGKTVCVRCHPDTAQAMRERAEWRAQNAAPRVPNPEWWASSAAESATVAYARNAQAAQDAQDANAIEDEEDHDDIEPDDEPEDDEPEEDETL